MGVWDKRDMDLDLTGERGLLHSDPCKSVSVGSECPIEPGGSSKPVSLFRICFAPMWLRLLMCQNMSSVL